MKKILTSILAGAIIGGCYKPPANLDFPARCVKSPYVSFHNKEKNFTIYTLPHSKHYIDEAKDKIAELIERAEKHLEKDIWFEFRKQETKVLILHGNDYQQLMRKYWPDNLRRIKGLGLYYIPNKLIILKSYYGGFQKPEQRVFVHEYMHSRDCEDGWEEFTDREITELTNKVLGKPLSPFFKGLK